MLNTRFHKEENKFDGIYRGRVVQVDVEDDGEKNKYGAVRVFIPDLMSKEIQGNIDEFKSGILAYPSNLQLGGYNDDDPNGTANFAAAGVYVPLLNSYVKIMFENGDLERAFYIGPWQDKIAPLPPVNRNVDEPHKVYTVLFSGEGRSIVVCDSKDQARVEITGKKRKLNADDGPAGNSSSTYEVDGNQTTIIIDETDGNEKILIRTHKGDFLKFDIEKQSLEGSFKGDILFKTDGKFQVTAKGGIDLKTEGSAAIESTGTMNIKATVSGIFMEGKLAVSLKSLGSIMIQGAQTFIQSQISCPARAALATFPQGDRSQGASSATSTSGTNSESTPSRPAETTD